MKKKSPHTPLFLPKELTTRRSLLSRAGAAIGAFLFSTSFPNVASAQTKEKSDSDPVFDIRKFGATGRREDNATKAFKDAMEACLVRRGGTINVPPGDYTVGTIELRDNTTLNIEAGATLFLSQVKDDFKPGVRSMIFAEKAKNIAVTGGGILNGLAQYDFAGMRGTDPEIKEEIEIARAAGVDMRRYYRKATAMNTFMFIMNDCTNFRLTDVTIINAPLWTVRLNDCHHVFVRGIYIYSDLEKGVNADGIDICSSSDVLISDSVIVTGDDSIVLKTIARDGNKANPCENITVTNCILSSSSTALMIGTETEADIRHVLFNNCVIRNSNKGFGINVQDGATVSNIVFSNLTIETNRRHWNWWGDAEIFKFVLKKRSDQSILGVIKNIKIDNIIATARGTSTITGYDGQPLENISINNMQLLMTPEDALDKRATHAINITGVKGMKIRDLTVSWTENETEKKWQSALVVKKVSDLMIDSFAGRQGLKSGKDPAILLENVSDVSIRNSVATEGTGTFIHLQGTSNLDIIIRNNLTKKASVPITYENNELKKVVDIKS